MTSFSVVEDLDVIKYAFNGLRPAEVPLVVDPLTLQSSEEAFRNGIVVAVALATHAAAHVMLFAPAHTIGRSCQMPVDYNSAKMTILTVLEQLGNRIDTEIKANLIRRMVSRRHSGEFFVILDWNTWRTDLTNFYNAYFSRIIGEGLLEPVLRGCHGFTTPFRHTIRRMFVPFFSDNGTLVHEFIHWLQHTNAYPNFYENDPDGSFFLEGITEYFTRLVYHGEDREGHYERQLSAVRNAIDLGAVTEEEIAAFSFRGEAFPEALRNPLEVVWEPGEANPPYDRLMLGMLERPSDEEWNEHEFQRAFDEIAVEAVRNADSRRDLRVIVFGPPGMQRDSQIVNWTVSAVARWRKHGFPFKISRTFFQQGIEQVRIYDRLRQGINF